MIISAVSRDLRGEKIVDVIEKLISLGNTINGQIVLRVFGFRIPEERKHKEAGGALVYRYTGVDQ